MMAMSLQQRPLPFFNGSLLFSSSNRQFRHRSATIFRWSFGRDQGSSPVTSRTKGRAFRILANPNVCFNQGFFMYNAKVISATVFMMVSSDKGNSGKEVIMVDPLEAKRLAAKQMVQIKAKEKAKRRRQIEAINGAWAMIGLTAGLVIEGQTGKGILEQLAGYLWAIVHIFVR
ncbi:Chloroa_b-bind domain-containing protein [Gossypium australe]|uniref:Chloroa_b-bind domain-containing protein n=1 Tax=Gossypium australe TaxID=47621 RepID=A0A5B6XCZ9_9ROSI|nr:Chloroa_b-bind domain-containing protein [Gossypium australe]